ncbi:MAG TPA: restriction endonuclease [Candidatus Binatia bacterium]|nr:restriction endonuclease [Candidatus Binatia bacterium]
MEEPSPNDFGLTTGFETRIQQIEKSQGQVTLMVKLLLLAVGCIALASEMKTSDLPHTLSQWIPFLFFGAVFLLIVMSVVVAYSNLLLSGIRAIWPNKEYIAYRRYLAATRKWEEWWIRTQKEFWLGLKPLSFEREVASLLQRAGYSARLTPASGDEGVDIFLADGTVVQCKAHKVPVSPAVARELYGTLKHFKASKAILVSRSGFSRGVREFAKGKPISLGDLSHLIGLQQRLGATSAKNRVGSS